MPALGRARGRRPAPRRARRRAGRRGRRTGPRPTFWRAARFASAPPERTSAMHTADVGPLRVSRLALGAMLLGDRAPAGEAERMLDAYVDAGGNLVDTADIYGDGASEETLAPWLARRRDEVVVATKVRFEVSDPGGAGPGPRTGCAAPATPACGGWASTSSTSTRSTRRTPTCRSAPRWRRSTGSCGPARCAPWAPRTSPPGSWPGPSRSRSARAGRRSCRCSRSTRSSSARSKWSSSRSAGRPGWPSCPGARSARAS